MWHSSTGFGWQARGGWLSSLFLFSENAKEPMKAMKITNLPQKCRLFLDNLLFFFSIMINVPFGIKKRNVGISNGGLYDETQRPD